jgi:hypothetical protein
MRLLPLVWWTACLAASVLSFECSNAKGSSCTISVASYDRSCQQDSDCVPVFSGSFCGSNQCACENAAIIARAQSQYSSAFNAGNPPRFPCPAAPPVACVSGTCALKAPATAEAGAD